MKKTMELPVLSEAGLGKRFKIFIEIARHPQGMSMSEVTTVFTKEKQGSKKFAYVKQGILYHITALREAGFISMNYDVQNGRVVLICTATLLGVSTVQEEMCRLCTVLHEIEKEMKHAA